MERQVGEQHLGAARETGPHLGGDTPAGAGPPSAPEDDDPKGPVSWFPRSWANALMGIRGNSWKPRSNRELEGMGVGKCCCHASLGSESRQQA